MSGFKYRIFLGNGFLRYGLVSSGQPKILFCCNRVFEPQKCNRNDKILFFFKPAHLRKVSCTRDEMLKYDLLESHKLVEMSHNVCGTTCNPSLKFDPSLTNPVFKPAHPHILVTLLQSLTNQLSSNSIGTPLRLRYRLVGNVEQ